MMIRTGSASSGLTPEYGVSNVWDSAVQGLAGLLNGSFGLGDTPTANTPVGTQNVDYWNFIASHSYMEWLDALHSGGLFNRRIPDPLYNRLKTDEVMMTRYIGVQDRVRKLLSQYGLLR